MDSMAINCPICSKSVSSECLRRHWIFEHETTFRARVPGVPQVPSPVSEELLSVKVCGQNAHWNESFEAHFLAKVARLATLEHANISPLLGYVWETTPFNRVIFYLPAEQGILNMRLHDAELRDQMGVLGWADRMRIICGVTRALLYLGSLDPPFSMALCSSAISLTSDLSPQLVDTETCESLMTRDWSISVDDFHRRQVSCTTDLAVVLLEIVSSRPHAGIIDWAKDLIISADGLLSPDGMLDILDDELVADCIWDDHQLICETVRLCIRGESEFSTLLERLEEGLVDYHS